MNEAQADAGEKHREFLLMALRAASTRAKLMDADITTIGYSLRAGLIDNETAVRWIMDCGLMGVVGALPNGVGVVAVTHGGTK